MRLVSRLEQESRLDRLMFAGQRAARLIRPGGPRDLLHGVWLGHPLHPLLIQAPVGAWVSASILDFSGGDEKAVRQLVTTGLITAVPAAIAGAADCGNYLTMTCWRRCAPCRVTARSAPTSARSWSNDTLA